MAMHDEYEQQDELQKREQYRRRSTAERGQRYQERLKRRTEALELRKRGKSYAAIATALGISTAQAHGDVQLALAALHPPERELATELRDVESERLDMAVAAIAPMVEQGEIQAVGRWIQVSARRAKLMGLDLPPQEAAKEGADGVLTIKVEYVNDNDDA